MPTSSIFVRPTGARSQPFIPHGRTHKDSPGNSLNLKFRPETFPQETLYRARKSICTSMLKWNVTDFLGIWQVWGKVRDTHNQLLETIRFRNFYLMNSCLKRKVKNLDFSPFFY